MRKPFLKWAGGKRQILNIILERINDSLESGNRDTYTFYEPFVGGGIVFLSLNHSKVVINDLNTELIKTYRAIRDNPEEVMKLLDLYYGRFIKSGSTFYYDMRKKDRNKKTFNKLSDVQIAARMIFLNKTCYNGLYRVNSEGYFNTPIGRNNIKSLYDRNNLLDISNYLKNHNIKILNYSYEEVLKDVKMGDVVYLDPPYDYKEDDGFTQYQKNGFSFDDFVKLKECCDKCLDKEAFVIISNNYTKKVINAFKGDSQHNYEFFDIRRLDTKRCINCKGNLRANGEEILIYGIPCKFPNINHPAELLKLIRVKNKEKIRDQNYLEKKFKQKRLKYISALKYLNIVGNDETFTKNGLMLRKIKKSKLEKEFAHLIVNCSDFCRIYVLETTGYSKRLTIDDIIHELVNSHPGIPHNVAQRRAQIIRNWIDWCIDKIN
ncbi:MAG: Dam family site-specific DNA-(adenine-N6)-methyltransferase [Bacilli bacterium]|nr:Dam family site-specific DNA-(adenine-N6)-methyltransferase [Bacilli bacterium]